MDGDEVAGRQQFGQAEGRCSGLLDGVRRYVGIVCLDRHPESEGTLGETAPDRAEADDPQGLSLHLESHELPGRAPVPGEEGRVGRHHVAGQGQHQGHGMVGHRGGLGAGCVDHRHAAVRGRPQVYLVHAYADPPDDLEPPATLQNLARDSVGEQVVDDRVGVAYRRKHVVLLGDRNRSHRADFLQSLARNRSQLHPVENHDVIVHSRESVPTTGRRGAHPLQATTEARKM